MMKTKISELTSCTGILMNICASSGTAQDAHIFVTLVFAGSRQRRVGILVSNKESEKRKERSRTSGMNLGRARPVAESNFEICQ